MSKERSSKNTSRNAIVRFSAWCRREPLVLFLLLGLALFGAERLLRPSLGSESFAIDVGEGEIVRISSLWEAQMGRAPTPAELDGLVDDHVREEVLYREAIRLGLDRNDTIVRRRLAQKMGFLLEDTLQIEEPSDADLARWYATQSERYREPARTTLAHIYFSRDRRGERSESDARELLAQLLVDSELQTGWRTLGDPFMLRREYADRSRRELSEQFGAGFSVALEALPVGAWGGPIPSVYGHHLVRVSGRSEAMLPELANVRDQVLQGYRDERRREANRNALKALRARYRVTSVLERAAGTQR